MSVVKPAVHEDGINEQKESSAIEFAVAQEAANHVETVTPAEPTETILAAPVTEGGAATVLTKAQSLMQEGLPYHEALSRCQEFNADRATPLSNKDLTVIVKSAYGYETESLPNLIKELNKKHAVVNMGGKFRILEEYIDPDDGLPDIRFSTAADFRAFYSNRKIPVGTRDLPLGAAWYLSDTRRTYKGITFNPRTTPPGYYNLWTGFAVKPKQGECSRFLAHIRDNIASGNQAIYDYIIAWMAQGVQTPDELIGVALALRGSMGTGKSVFANAYGSLFGRHFMQLSQGAQLTGKFNAHMKDKCVVFADEAFWAGDKQAEGVLKAMITEPALVIEGKGENAFKIKNHIRFIFATNNEWIAPAGPQERRFFVLDVGEGRMRDQAYFGAIKQELDNGGREALLHYLLNYDIYGLNLRQYPQTAALMEQKLYSMTPVQKFVFEKLEAGSLGNDGKWDEIPTKDLYSQYINFCIRIGERYKLSDSEFGRQLKKLMPDIRSAKGRSSTYRSQRPNVYRFPALRECRRVFERFMNYQIEWPVYEEDAPATGIAPDTSNETEAEQVG